ncbi:MAG: uracil-DNA glycosylase family protein [Acidobacteriota bacterium]
MSLSGLLDDVSRCEICQSHLPLGPRPLLRIESAARLVIIGQAPGRLAHQSGIPWNDPSGDRLRDWLGISREEFYRHPALAIMPMGFCFPGTGRGGDLAPRPECASTWHAALLAEMPRLETTLLIGRYAQNTYLDGTKRSVTAAVKTWAETFPRLLPLPHPSPRNNRWLKQNPWFEIEVLPALRRKVAEMLSDHTGTDP